MIFILQRSFQLFVFMCRNYVFLYLMVIKNYLQALVSIVQRWRQGLTLWPAKWKKRDYYKFYVFENNFCIFHYFWLLLFHDYQML